jgi:uncharacterized surface protein with fasciclin (FAS1) repeats
MTIQPTIRRLTAGLAVLALCGTVAAAAVAPAQAAAKPLGTQSIATVLAADGNHFDHNPRDFDILDRAVRTVLKADPKSPVAVLSDGTVPLTVFAPSDGAFRHLAENLTGKHLASERAVFRTIAKATGVKTLESVLLYHVVPGSTITAKQAAASDGATLRTALENGTVTIKIRRGHVAVVDRSPSTKNARVAPALADINKGNRQIAHGITQVLLPS